MISSNMSVTIGKTETYCTQLLLFSRHLPPPFVSPAVEKGKSFNLVYVELFFNNLILFYRFQHFYQCI